MTFTSSDPVRCAEAIVDRVGRDLALAVPIGIGKPIALVNALYRLAEADRRLRLRIFTGLCLVRPPYRTTLERRFVEPLLDRLFATYPELAYAKALRGERLPPNVEVNEFFLQAGAWLVQRARAAELYEPQLLAVSPRTSPASASTSSLSSLRRTRTAHARVSLSSNTDVTLDMRPYIGSAAAPAGRSRSPSRSTPTCPICLARRRSIGAVRCAAGNRGPALRPVRAAQGARIDRRLRDGAACGDPHQGRRHAADRHRLVLRRAGARADPRHTSNGDSGRCSTSSASTLRPDAELAPFGGLYGCTEMLVDGFLALKRAGVLRRRVATATAASPAARRLLRRQPGLLRELREMPRRSSSDRHDRHLLHQYAGRR